MLAVMPHPEKPGIASGRKKAIVSLQEKFFRWLLIGQAKDMHLSWAVHTDGHRHLDIRGARRAGDQG
jgi:hypothetical protein